MTTLDENMNAHAKVLLQGLINQIKNGEVQILTAGKWPIGQGKFGASIYWTVKENNGKQNTGPDNKSKKGSTVS